jgi:hypothetical protein
LKQVNHLAVTLGQALALIGDQPLCAEVDFIVQ